MTNYFPRKPFDYAAFIDRVRELHQTGMAFPAAHDTVESLAFQSWRIRLDAALEDVGKLKYRVKCDVRERHFKPLWNASKVEQTAVYVTDMNATVTELQLLIQSFDMHGDPQVRAAGQSAQTVQALEEQVRNERASGDIARAKSRELELALQTLAEQQKQTPPEALKVPDKGATLAWMFENVPASVWFGAGGALVVAFGLGVSFGNWPSVQAGFEHWAKPAASATGPIPPASGVRLSK